MSGQALAVASSWRQFANRSCSDGFGRLQRCQRGLPLNAAAASKIPSLKPVTSRLYSFGNSRHGRHLRQHVPNRANYGGKTRRTSKIHWQKGRSTVTGHRTL